MEGTAWRADGEFFVFVWLVFARSTGKTCVGKLLATFFPWYPHLIIRYSNMK